MVDPFFVLSFTRISSSVSNIITTNVTFWYAKPIQNIIFNKTCISFNLFILVGNTNITGLIEEQNFFIKT